MTCDEYLELLSARLDGVLTEAEERALEEHQAGCPACRAAGAQLAALQPAFGELEEFPAPEGFARGVMERIRAEEPRKVIPLFKRPQFRAIAGLAACAVLAVGLYGAVQQQKDTDEERYVLMTRSFNQDAQDVLIESSDVPQVTAYSDLNMSIEGSDEGLFYEMQKTVPEYDVSYDGAVCAPMSNTKILTLDRMPSGGWELIPPETPVSPEGVHVTEELFEEIEQLAIEQEITGSITSNEMAEEFVIVVLNETE